MFNNLYIRGAKLREFPQRDLYLRSIPAIRHLYEEGLEFTRPVTFFVGENGTGKSTLTEAIACAYGFNPEGGTRNLYFSTRSTHSALWEELTVVKAPRKAKDGFFLRAESFYNVATDIDRVGATAYYGGISLHAQSHGESFLSLVHHRFGGHGVYILDEPEAALSPMRLLSLLCEMQRLVQADSQFLIATHSPILMAFPGADVMEITQSGIRSVPYKQTEHYRLTRRFLENPESLLGPLLSEE